MNDNIIELEEKIRKGGYNRIVRFSENILLRADDEIKLMGKEKFDFIKKAFENVLEDYKQDKIYEYYYTLNTVPHGFCVFERWKRGYLF
ncbi:hypothetical protein [Clostridium sp. M14]|uniref:hypothetical protein n=1 Tax=Clostridium sp. M14 TaxID=2716311 RepID=UPI0013EE46B5|nr:hypothetical protein [Clostridium sp. M14]MBZ9693365.1 hypothetical protein [Clostridium sp. M14]